MLYIYATELGCKQFDVWTDLLKLNGGFVSNTEQGVEHGTLGKALDSESGAFLFSSSTNLN